MVACYLITQKGAIGSTQHARELSTTVQEVVGRVLKVPLDNIGVVAQEAEYIINPGNKGPTKLVVKVRDAKTIRTKLKVLCAAIELGLDESQAFRGISALKTVVNIE